MGIKSAAESCLRIAFFVLVRFCVLILLGLNVRGRGHLPLKGPAIIAANHNSHLDTLVLMSLFPLSTLSRIRPVAAADYFLRNKWLAWFSLSILRIIPMERGGANRHSDPLAACCEALGKGDILILFPEGTRGEPETLAQFKHGIAHLAQRCGDAPVVPIFLYGLGKALPKGELILVPFFCDIFIGEPIRSAENRALFMQTLNERFNELGAQAHHASWE